jgi:superfamily II DNA or RNA helicase
MVTLRFSSGTLEVKNLHAESALLPARCCWDERSACFRAKAVDYASVVRALVHAKIPFEDQARGYTELGQPLRLVREARPYQTDALTAWHKGQGRGVVVLPTGAGKSYLALMAIDLKQRSTLVIAPTLDLVRQWYDLLRTSFGVAVGVIGGGEYQLAPLTVTTYDSAYLHMEHLGNRFGLVIFDEVHHLPGQAYALAAACCLAPFRLGLTATPQRSDGRELLLQELVGPTLFHRDIVDLSGSYLAEYETIRITLELTQDERLAYDEARGIYLDFLRRHGIHLSGASGWSDFIMRAAQSEHGQQALAAHRRQQQLAFAASAKLDCVDHLLRQHQHDRALLFTQSNAAAYEISRRFLIPAITHQTKITERSEVLAGLMAGTYSAVVTSKVLNEGVDLPEANVAIVVSGSASVREHVQRLGRVLRKKGDKRAVLYELVTNNTSETFTSGRRRDHVAYR